MSGTIEVPPEEPRESSLRPVASDVENPRDGRRWTPPMRRGRRRALVGGATVALVIAALLLWRSCAPPNPTPIHAVAVGDIACDPTDPEFAGGAGKDGWCQQKATSDLALSLHPSLFLGLGDYQYELPSSAGYQDVYAPSWGRLRSITKPALGNQELKVFHANTFR